MNDEVCTIQASLRWWVMPYLITLYWLASLIEDEPKSEHVEWIIEKGVRLVMTPCDPPP
jgi:hypothetical protein